MTARPGASLLELLIVLAVLAAVMSALAARPTGPSDRLRLQGAVAAVQKEAAFARGRAVRSGTPVDFEAGPSCDGGTGPIVFARDGTARGPDICLGEGARTVRLAVHPLFGRLEVVP